MYSNWMDDFPGAITMCDAAGTIVYMNRESTRTFAKYGGPDLVGQSLLDCHPETARDKIRDLMSSREPNTYTVEKQGVRKLIHQAPLWNGGEFQGLIELSLVLPPDMPHFVRT